MVAIGPDLMECVVLDEKRCKLGVVLSVALPQMLRTVNAATAR